ncbi:ATP-dependent Clp protease proteolytic subunit [Phyllobacterium sp. K27]
MFLARLGYDGKTLDPNAEEVASTRRRADQLRSKGEFAGRLEITIKGPVTDEMAAEVLSKLSGARAAREIALFIDSTGGDCYAAVLIHSLIRLHAAERKVAHVIGACQSSAMLIAMAADCRFAHPNSTFLLHPSSFHFSETGSWTASQLAEELDNLRAIDQDIAILIAERSGASVADIAQEASNENPSSLPWCLHHGLIHAVLEDLP